MLDIGWLYADKKAFLDFVDVLSEVRDKNIFMTYLTKTLLDIFWNNHDPTTSCSRQYMSAIFYHSEEQRSEAEKSMKVAQENNRRNITTLILPAKEFYNAEQ